MASTSKRQNALSIQTKINILKAVDASVPHRTKTEICKEFGIPNSTLSTILRNRKKLNAAYEESSFEPGRKRMRMAKHGALEAALLLWFKEARSLNIPISGPILGEMAELLAKCTDTKFKSNPGWIERFKNRNGIIFTRIAADKTLAFVKEISSKRQKSREHVVVENPLTLADLADSDPLSTESQIVPFERSSPFASNEVCLHAKEMEEEEDEEEEEEECVDPTPIPSASEIGQSLHNIRRFLENEEDGFLMYQNLQDMDLYFHGKFQSKSVQTKITDYFIRK